MNVINCVPRELLERISLYLHTEYEERGLHEELRALLSTPSPAGVDGLEVVGYVSRDDIKWQGDCTLRLKPYSDYTIPLCRLSDAQAIIDGLRGEVGEDRAKVAQLEEGIPRIMEASYQFRQQRDQLAGLLREVHGKYKTGIPYSLGERIDAALSSGKEGE